FYLLSGDVYHRHEIQAVEQLDVVLAIAVDQGFVALAEVDAQSASHSIKTGLADEAVGKQRRHTAAAERKAIFAAQGQHIASDGVDVPDRELEIVGDVIGYVERIEEAVGNGKCRHTGRDHRRLGGRRGRRDRRGNIDYGSTSCWNIDYGSSSSGDYAGAGRAGRGDVETNGFVTGEAAD